MFQFESKVRYSEVNSERVLKLAALTDYLQDCCTFQTEEMGVGMDYLKDFHGGWVLSSWEIVIKELPKLSDVIRIGTFPYDFKGFYGLRNFCVENEAFERIAFANSVWVYMNTETMRPERVPESVLAAYHEKEEEPIPFAWSDRKIKVEGEGVAFNLVEVSPYFIDTNRHMNNGKYIMVAESYLPEGFTVGRIRAEYRKAAVLGDILHPIIYKEENVVTVELADEAGKPYAVVQFIRNCQ